MISSKIVKPVAGLAGAIILTLALGACVSSNKSMSKSKQSSMSTSLDSRSKKSSDSSTMMTAAPKGGSSSTMSGGTTMSSSTSK